MRKQLFGVARLAATLSAGLALAGCVAFGDVAPQAYEIGQSVGTSSNQAILLNIARASLNEPLYFTQISQVSGSGNADLKTGLPNLFIGAAPTGAAGTLSVTNSADNSQSTNFQVGVLNSSDFYHALLAPLTLPEVGLLLQQNFPRELIFRLVVDKARAQLPDRVQEIENKAGDPHFEPDLQLALDYGLTVETYQEQNPDWSSSSQHAGAGGTKPGAGSGDSGSQVSKYIPGAKLCFDETQALDGDKALARKPGSKCLFPPTVVPGKGDHPREIVLPVGGIPTTFEISLRSPYQIFQYLGLILEDPASVPTVMVRNGPSGPLLDIGSAATPCFTEVVYENRKYCAPANGKGFTKQVFSILNQILALNTSPSTLPATTTVQLLQ